MSKRRFAVIGHPIGHTMSPFIHKRLFEIAGLEGEYTVEDVPPETLGARMKELDRLAGYNITIPNKQRIIPYLDRLDSRAELYGSVNTVCNGSVRTGYTTDPDGFLKALEHGGIKLAGRVVLLGCGGASRTFAFEAAQAGCSITIAARPESSARQLALANEIREKTGVTQVSCCLLSEISGDFDLLVNGTPVGMYPNTGSMAVSEKALSRCACVFDAVYNPLKTRLIEAAEANGSAAVGGMSMLVWQAVAAHKIWDGTEYDPADIDQLVEDSAKEQSRIFL